MRVWGVFLLVGIIAGMGMASELTPGFQSTGDNSVRFAYNAGAFSEVRLKDAELALEVWSESLRKKLGSITSKVTAVILDGVSELEKALLKSEIDVVILGPLEFFELEKKNLLDPVLVPFYGEQVTQKYLMLARKDRIQQATQMNGKKAIVQTGGQGTLPLIWIERVMIREGFSEGSKIFKELKKVDKASQALLPVFFEQSDICVVTDRSYSTMIEMNPQIGNELGLLLSSDELLRGLICFRKDFPQEKRKEILDIMTTFHEEPEGGQILMIFHEEKLVPFQSRYIESARKLLNELSHLRSNTGAEKSPGN